MALFNADEARRDLDILNGYGPGGSLNFAAGDGYYAASLREKWRMSIEDLEAHIDYRGVSSRRIRAQAAYDRIMAEGAEPVEHATTPTLDKPRRVKL